jgi:hypothetical protein
MTVGVVFPRSGLTATRPGLAGLEVPAHVCPLFSEPPVQGPFLFFLVALIGPATFFIGPDYPSRRIGTRPYQEPVLGLLDHTAVQFLVGGNVDHFFYYFLKIVKIFISECKNKTFLFFQISKYL